MKGSPADRSLTLHGGPNSPFVRKVLVVAAETGALADMALVRTHPPATMACLNPDLLAINPLGKVPTLILPDGRPLYDSDVICEYLDATYGEGRLHPPVGPLRWRMLRWNALGSTAMDALVLWRFERNRPAAEQSADVLKTFEGKIASALDAVESEIAALAAEPFGIGQIAIGCFLEYLDYRFSDVEWRGARAQTARWLEQFNARPSSRMSRHGEPSADDVAHGPRLEWT